MMFNDMLKLKKPYVVVGLIILVAATHFELVRHNDMKWQKKYSDLQEQHQNTVREADKLQKRLETMEQFLEETNVRQVIEANEHKVAQMAQLRQQLLGFQSVEAQLRRRLSQLEEVFEHKDAEWQKDLDRQEKNLRQKISVEQGRVQKLRNDLQALTQRPLYNLSQKYVANGVDISDLVVRLRFLKYLSEHVEGSMVAKKVAYKQLLDDFRSVLKSDAYVRKLKPVKIYPDVPIMADFKGRYIDKKTLNEDNYVGESNQRIAEQLGYLLDYIKMTYV